MKKHGLNSELVRAEQLAETKRSNAFIAQALEIIGDRLGALENQRTSMVEDRCVASLAESVRTLAVRVEALEEIRRSAGPPQNNFDHLRRRP